MSSLIRTNEPAFMTAQQAAQRSGFAARSELRMRELLEAFCRERWAGARICHEMVMGEGKVRADVVAIDPAHMVAFEVKGAYDDTTRLLHQVGMYQLATPEVWMVVCERQVEDAELIHHLLPSVGLIRIPGIGRSGFADQPDAMKIEILHESVPRAPVPQATLALLWRDELVSACDRHRVARGKKPTRAAMIKALLERLEPEEIMPAVCHELRARDALWRADPPLDRTAEADTVKWRALRP